MKGKAPSLRKGARHPQHRLKFVKTPKSFLVVPYAITNVGNLQNLKNMLTGFTLIQRVQPLAQQPQQPLKMAAQQTAAANSVSHIITYPSKELCSKMALGEVGVSLP